MDEIELKFLDIDVDEIKEKIVSLGAVQKFDSKIKSYPFLAKGFSSWDSRKEHLRVRKIGDEVILTYKGPQRESEMNSKEEFEVKVSDFETIIKIIEQLGFRRGDLFRKHRVHYELGNIHFELDTVENIPTYLEVETQSEEDMIRICKELGLNLSDGKVGSIFELLPEKFKK